MRSLVEKLSSTTVYATAMAIFFWLLSERGADRVLEPFAFLLSFVALASLFFAFFHKEKEVDRE